MIKCKSICHMILLVSLLSLIVCMVVSCSDNVDKMHVTGNGITCKAQVVIDYGLCGSCDTCFTQCPVKAITKTELDGILVYIIDPEKCLKCGICIEKCPYDAITWKH